jgi:1A family penicillin-binding protein
MAQSKKTKKTKKRQAATFYEAVPMTVTPPAVLPHARETFSDALAAMTSGLEGTAASVRSVDWSGFWKIDAAKRTRLIHLAATVSVTSRRFLSKIAANLKWAGLSTTNIVLAYGRTAAFNVRYGADAAITYGPSIASDLGAYARNSQRALIGRQARLIYLALIITGIATGVGITASMAAQTIKTYASDISSPAALLATKKTGITILDRNGKVLFEGYGGQDTTVVPMSGIPTSLKNATLAAEDPSFYSHSAFSVKSTLRAAVVDILNHGTVQGGSTLTQQLVKNALLTQTKTFTRKYQEVLLAIDLENKYSKDQIMDMYLNEVYYGQGASGVEAASETYFHEPVSKLTLGQSALIAGLPLGPSRFDPNASVSEATGRRDFVLSRMAQLGMITQAQAKTAENQPIQLAAVGAAQTAPTGSSPMLAYSKQVSVQAPWFVFYVLDQLRQQYGDEMVEQGDLTVRTTLDLTKENMAEQDISQQINNLSSHNVTNGALISLDPSTGDIISMVGSVNYNAPGFGNVNVTLADRQPGSSFKPIAYATAFEKGWTGATTVLDAPVSFPGANGTTYTPQNYDQKFHGVVTLRHALDNSLNIPAIKVLQYATIPATLQTAHDIGITTLNDPSQYGLSLVLGGGDVRPIDMATAYATFDNLGVTVEPKSILSVTDRYGKNITKPDPTKPKATLDPRISYMITNILSDNSARLPEFPINSPLALSRPAAAKTGTTDDFRDNWTVGYTPQLVTAVWVGNDNNTAMNNVDGITGAAPIWHNYMEQALAGTPVENFTVPAGIVTAQVCSNGDLAGPGVPGYPEVFMNASEVPTQQCYSNNQTSPFDSYTQPSDSNTSSTPVPTPTPNPEPPTPEPVPTPDQPVPPQPPIF